MALGPRREATVPASRSDRRGSRFSSGKGGIACISDAHGPTAGHFMRAVPHWPSHQRATPSARRPLSPAPTRKVLVPTSIKLGLTALIAAILLAGAVSTASAGRLEVSNQRFRVTWSNLEFRGFFAIRCQVTLEGSFHERTIVKSEGILLGAITRINISEEGCFQGRIRPVQPPPWHLTYEGFTEALPRIRTLRILLSRFQFQATEPMGTPRCKYGTAVDNITFSALINGGLEITNFQPLSGRNIAHLLDGPIACPADGTLVASNADGVVTLLNTTTRITVRLI